jgi:hypothetical protein
MLASSVVSDVRSIFRSADTLLAVVSLFESGNCNHSIVGCPYFY